jgi:hypothetical protein
VRADLGDAGAVEDDDEVGRPRGGEAVRHQDGDATRPVAAAGRPGGPARGGVALEERVLGLRVEGRLAGVHRRGSPAQAHGAREQAPPGG